MPGLFEHDDITCLVRDHFRLASLEEKRALIGYTQPHEEKHFRTGDGNAEVDVPTHLRTAVLYARLMEKLRVMFRS